MLENFDLLLAHFIGDPLSSNFVLLILIVPFCTFLGRLLVGWSRLLSICYPLACICLNIVFVVPSSRHSVTSCLLAVLHEVYCPGCSHWCFATLPCPMFCCFAMFFVALILMNSMSSLMPLYTTWMRVSFAVGLLKWLLLVFSPDWRNSSYWEC